MRRTIEYHASRRHDSEPTSYRLALPYVVFVVSTYRRADRESVDLLPDGAAALARRPAVLARPCRTRTTMGSSVSGRSGSAGATVGERVDALIGAFWASRFNQDLRRHPLPFSGGFRSWASRSRRDPLAALSLAYDPYWRTLRQVVAQMAGLAPTDLPAGRADPRGTHPRPMSGRRNRPRPKEVTPMRSLPDVVGRMPISGVDGSRSLLAPHLRNADPVNPLSGLEASALAVAVAILRASGRQLREELVRERSRSRQLEQLVYRLPAAERGGS